MDCLLFRANMHPKVYKFQRRGASIRPAPRCDAMFDVGYFPPNTPPGE